MARHREIKVVLLGPVGAGKTTMFQALVHGMDRRARELGVVVEWRENELVQLSLETAPPADTDLKPEIRGSLAVFGRRYELLVTNPPGGDLAKAGVDDGLIKRTADCDLLVLVVDPPSLVNAATAALVRQRMLVHVTNVVHARRAKKGHEPVIALAFTKADEYSIPLGRSPRLRFIQTDAHRTAFEAWHEGYRAGASAEDRWRTFVEELCPSSDTIRDVRREVLDSARKYVEAIVANAGVRPECFNMYFVVARPADPHVRPYPWDRRGVNEIFEDFIRIVTETQSEPPLKLKWAAAFTAACATLFFLSFAYTHGGIKGTWPTVMAAFSFVGLSALVAPAALGPLVQRVIAGRKARTPPAVSPP